MQLCKQSRHLPTLPDCQKNTEKTAQKRKQILMCLPRYSDKLHFFGEIKNKQNYYSPQKTSKTEGTLYYGCGLFWQRFIGFFFPITELPVISTIYCLALGYSMSWHLLQRRQSETSLYTFFLEKYNCSPLPIKWQCWPNAAQALMSAYMGHRVNQESLGALVTGLSTAAPAGAEHWVGGWLQPLQTRGIQEGKRHFKVGFGPQMVSCLLGKCSQPWVSSEVGFSP